MADTYYNFIMTDVPYGTYSDTDPDLISMPMPDAGVGRIFADKPSELIKIIDGYEQNLDFSAGSMNAVIFGG